MFGGLELKGTDSKDSDAGSSSAAPAPAPPAASGFGFMNSSAPAVEEPVPAAAMEAPAPAAASSGFSFLNPEPAAPSPEPTPAAAPEPAPAASSGFDFLMSTTATAPAPAPEPAAATEPAPAAASSFDFLMSTTATDAPAAPAAPEPAPAAASSGFDFLMSTTSINPTSPPEPAPVETEETPAPLDLSSGTPTISTSSLGSAPAAEPAPSLMDMSPPKGPAPTSSAFPPAGAGISFGVAAKRGGVKKKKTRAARVGMGSATVTPSSPSKRPQPAPAPAPVATLERKDSARDEAEEAAKRAEEFMSQMAAVQDEGPPEITTAPSSDSVLQAAEKAAKEAKVLSRQQQSQQKQKGGFMGTFFKGFGGNNQGAPPPAKRGSSGSSQKSTASVDRLANKQKDMKRAMAEREMSLQKQSQQSKPKEPTAPVSMPTPTPDKVEEKEEEDIAVSISVPSYSPEPTTTTTTTTDSNPISSHFEPAKPPIIVVQELKPTPAPRKTKTPEDVFEEHEALFAQSVHKAMKQVENVRSTQKMLLEERHLAMAKLNLSEQQIKQVEAQLQVAVEEEDYELADQLGQVAEAHKREKEEVSMMLDANVKALEHLDSQKHLVVLGVATCFSNLALRLTELKEKESSKDHSNDSGTFQQFEAIAKQLSVEKERLQQDAKHLERDEQLVAEERKDLESAISDQSGVLEQQRDDVKVKLEGVEAEIEELRKQLEAKQNIAAGLRTEMFGFEDSIDKVRVKFSRQLNRVDKKERALQENRNEFEMEEQAFERQKEAHEMQVQSHSEAMLKHDTLMKQLESELKFTKEFAEMIPEKVGFLEESPNGEKSDQDDEGDLASLQADVVKCEAAASEAKIILKAANSTIANLESELALLASKIPQLEATKRSAAASRDFKAASKASKEIKDATGRMKECQEELVGDAANRKTAAEEEAVRLNAELEKTRKVAQEKEKISAQTKMVALAESIEQLTAIQSKMCGETTSSESSVRGVGALVLEGQINSLKAEGGSLGHKYGGWKQLVGDEEDKAETKDTNVEAPEEGAEEAKPAVDDGLTSRERILKVRELLQRISDAEESLEAAASREAFDEAAELHNVFQNLQSELEKIDLTEDEMEIAMGDGDLPPEEEKAAEDEPAVEESDTEEGETEVAEPAAEDSAAEESETEVVEPAGDEESDFEEKKEEETVEDEDGNSLEVEADLKEQGPDLVEEETKPEVVASGSMDEEPVLQDEEATLDA